MKNQIAAHSPDRLFLAKLKMAGSKFLLDKDAAGSAAAAPAEKKIIQERILREMSVRERTLNHKPSFGTLW